MNPIDIVSQLKTQLKNYADLSYIKNVFIGKRSNIADYPVIVIDPQGSRLITHQYPNEIRILRVGIGVGVRVYNEDQQIIGSGSLKGSYDVKKDVSKALYSDHTLSGKCSDLNIVEDVDDEGEEYPIKGFILNIDITFEQNRETQA